jgi:C-terminal processing protease CtpA/Prc
MLQPYQIPHTVSEQNIAANIFEWRVTFPGGERLREHMKISRRLAASVTGSFLFGLCFFAAKGVAVQEQVQFTCFTNADFEVGSPNETPPGWFVPKILADAGCTAVIVTNEPAAGKQCVEVRWRKDIPVPSDKFGNVMQRIDATLLRGRQIKVTASIRVHAVDRGQRAQMWLRVDRPGGVGAFDNMNNRPVLNESWRDYSIVADIADDAQTINLGLMTFNGVTASWDNVRCEVLGEFTTLTEPPRPLSDTGLSNLVAFARLLGYVRHFHPSDQAASTNWLNFVAPVLPSIESANDPADLAERLEAAFRPVAPTVRVFLAGHEVPLSAEVTNASAYVRVWEHTGCSQSSAGVEHVYQSRRLRLDAKDAAALPAYARPTNVFRGNLGRGLVCVVPTAVYADDDGTLPHVGPATAVSGPQIRFSVAHRSARLTTVMLAWNILQHFYPYFDVTDVDWPRELQVALGKAATDADDVEFYKTLNRLIVALRDGHGTLVGPGMRRETRLPLQVELVQSQIVIVSTPVGATNLHPGDVVESLDGVPALEVFRDLESEVSASTPERRKQVAFRFGEGRADRSATLVVRGEGGQSRTVTVVRTNDASLSGEKRPAKIEEVKPGVFYVDITRLADREFKDALPRLAAAKALVFDMRGYPPGSPEWLRYLSPKPIQSAYWNIPRQHRPDWTDVEWVTSRWDLTPLAPQLTTNRVFLIDGRAISYAESVMGIVEAYQLGEIVGEPTAGTNGNINPTELPLGYQMIWTGMQVLKHDGTRHQGVGIRPTVNVSRTIQGVREGRDEILECALRLCK